MKTGCSAAWWRRGPRRWPPVADGAESVEPPGPRGQARRGAPKMWSPELAGTRSSQHQPYRILRNRAQQSERGQGRRLGGQGDYLVAWPGETPGPATYGPGDPGLGATPGTAYLHSSCRGLHKQSPTHCGPKMQYIFIESRGGMRAYCQSYHRISTSSLCMQTDFGRGLGRIGVSRGDLRPRAGFPGPSR